MHYINLLSLLLPYGNTWKRGTGMIPWTFVIWTFKQFDFCFLFINCPHLKNFFCSLAFLFWIISWIHYYKDVRVNTPRINVKVLCMPSTYLLVFFLKSHALTASQPLHWTHHTGRDIFPQPIIFTISSQCLAVDFHKTTPLKATGYHSPKVLVIPSTFMQICNCFCGIRPIIMIERYWLINKIWQSAMLDCRNGSPIRQK